MASGPANSASLNARLLFHIVGDGERVVAERDLVGGDKSEHGSKESGGVHSDYGKSLKEVFLINIKFDCVARVLSQTLD